MQKQTYRILPGIANGMAAGALWGFVFLAPQILHDFTPVEQSTGRYLIYGFVTLFLLLLGRKSGLQLHRRNWWTLVWLSLLGNIFYYILLSSAVQLIGIAPVTLIIGAMPALVTLWGCRDQGAAPWRWLLAPLGLCCAGTFMISWQALQSSQHGATQLQRVTGVLCAFCALLSWTIYAIGNSRYLVRHAQVTSQEWSLLTGVVTGLLAVPMGAFAFFAQPMNHSQIAWSRFWLVCAAVAILASVVGNRFWNQASRLLPLTLTGQMILFETLFALLYSFLWERRWPTGSEVFAFLCILSGIVWSTALHKNTKTNENPC
jgi:drug/metabolite transporter (DMT)-like permease